MQQTKRCGSCHFAKLIDRDITKRMCHGAPPTAIQVPAPIPGQMTFQMARPIVSVVNHLVMHVVVAKVEQDDKILKWRGSSIEPVRTF